MPDPDPVPAPWGRANTTLRTAAHALVVLAATWYLLGQLASVLRPLLMAALLGYVLLPYYRGVSRRLTAPVAITLLAGATTLVLVGLAAAVTASVVDLTTQAPELKRKALRIFSGVAEWVYSFRVVGPVAPGDKTAETLAAEKLTDGLLALVNVVAVGLPEAFAAGLYLLFLLLESARFPARVRAAYPAPRADRILHVSGRINAAIVGYLKAKGKASLLLAGPVGLLLVAFDVRFAFLWAVLTFVCNFIPYIGSAVAFALPVGFAFLQFESWVTATVLGGLVLLLHTLSASVVEPLLIGRAVGLSPLVILSALAVWGVLWGVPGMFLAVPLTVVVKIVLENVEGTRPVARLLSGE